MTVAAPPSKETRFGGKLALSRVHWVRPQLVAEITYRSWAEDGLILRGFTRRQTGEQGPAREARVNMRNGRHVSRAICQKNRMDRGSHSA
jgi:hypothetical protein